MLSEWAETRKPVQSNEPHKDVHKRLREKKRFEEEGVSRRWFPLIPIFYLRTLDAYIRLVFTEIGRYLLFSWRTWRNLIIQTHKNLFGGRRDAESLEDWFAHAFFAVGGIIALFPVLILCLIARIPILGRLYFRWSNLFGGGLGLVNGGNPNLFKELSQDQAQAARVALSLPYDTQNNTTERRVFNYDIAKMLLQFSSIIYEHWSDKINESVSLPTPGEVYRKVLHRSEEVDQVDHANVSGDASIHKFCAQFGIEFEPVSNLNNGSSAFCGLFWDPESNWIVVAMKGTGPIEFGEWLTDLDATMVPLNPKDETFIEGFEGVHQGFKNRVFPDDQLHKRTKRDQDRRPYNTIAESIKALSEHLREFLPAAGKVNVWFTGHSLGCATASLVYSRLVMNPEELGPNTVLRDAYLFAAPIVCDPASVRSFNEKFNDEDQPKTMWRITSNDDIVATGLPERGNQKVYPRLKPGQPHPRTNNFDFAHLGTEIVMYDHPHPSDVRGNHVPRGHGTEVIIASAFTDEEIEAHRGKRRAKWGSKMRENIGIALQLIPGLGRVVAHCTIYYWDQLDRIALKKCDWVAY